MSFSWRGWYGLEPVIKATAVRDTMPVFSFWTTVDPCSAHQLKTTIIILLATLNVNELLLLVSGYCAIVHSSSSTQEVSASRSWSTNIFGIRRIRDNTIFTSQSWFFMRKGPKRLNLRHKLKFHTVANFPTVRGAEGYKYFPHGNYFSWLQRTMGT